MSPDPLPPADLAPAAALLRQLLAAVEAGTIEATTPNARALLRRLEGAAAAVELLAGLPPPRTAA
jgi:hypothetical protein